jgi:hypothetical protein
MLLRGLFILFVLSLWLSRRGSLLVPRQSGIVFLLESWLESAPAIWILLLSSCSLRGTWSNLIWSQLLLSRLAKIYG